MKKTLLAVTALCALAAFMAAGCGGGGGGAAITVQPKSGGKVCVPQSSWRAAASGGMEEYRTLQGKVDFSGIAEGNILVTFSEGVPPQASGTRSASSAKFREAYKKLQQRAAAQYATDTMYFYAEGSGAGSSECGDYLFWVFGSVDSSNQFQVLEDTSSSGIYSYSYGYDECGDLTVDFSGAKGAVSANGSVTLSSATGTTAASPYSYTGTWSAADLNCIRIAQNGVITPNTVTVESGGEVDFDSILYDLSCNQVDPISYTDGGETFEMSYWQTGSELYDSQYDYYYISSDNNIGTIDWNTGVLTATDTLSTVSGQLWVFYGGLFDKITITVSPNTTEVVTAHVAAAKGYLFKSTVSATDFDNAKTEINAALAADADNPDANLLKALVDVGTEIERWDYEVDATAESNFPFNPAYRMASKMLGDAVEPVVDFVTGPYPKQAVRLSSDPENSAVQTEVENSLPAINSAVTALEYVKSYIDSHPSWTFAYPKDVAYPSLGDNYIDAKDVKTLLGAMYVLKGFTNYGLAYQCDYDEDTFEVTDSDSSGKIEPDEQFPNAACGTLRTNGASYLSTAQTYIASGLTMLDAAVTAILAEAAPTLGGEAIESQDIADAQHYQHYLTELAASFGGTATSITIPEKVECYYTDAYGVRMDEIFEPDYNTDETAKCDIMITAEPEITASIKFSALFSPAISDWRSITPNLVIYEEEDIELVESSGGQPVMPNGSPITLNGMFPNGVQASWLNKTSAEYWFGLSLVDSGGNPIDCSSFYSSATLTIGSKTLTATFCGPNWPVDTSQSKLIFENPSLPETAPSSSDAVTANEMIGTQATLSGVSGCNDKTFTVNGTDFDATIALSGASCNVPATASKVAAGGVHTCAVFTNGAVKCWGYDGEGQLGNGTGTDSWVPVAVGGITDATDVLAGYTHTCALFSGGTVKCWGYNGYGTLGNGTTTSSSTPVSVSGISGATDVSGGQLHTCAVLSDGTVKCWGYNNYGQLGNGTTTNSSTPVTVSGISGATDVSAGDTYTCALLSGGTIKCWGYNNAGQLGDGTTTTSYTPVAVSGISGATDVSAGNSHTCAILSGGSVKCWGSNGSGRLGDGTNTDSSTPVAASGVSGATGVSAGDAFTCAVFSGGSIKCWGFNESGQLGNGTTSDMWTATSVSGMSGATDVSAGLDHACAVISDGTLKCWGNGGYGKLGDGTANSSSTPVSVVGL